MRITRPDTNIKVTEFSSIQELVTYLNTTEMNSLFKNKAGGPASMRNNDSAHNKWAGSKSFEEAMDLLKTGWSEKATELESKLGQKLNKEASQVIRQKSVYDVVGGNASVPRYLQGVPTSMIRQVRTPVKQKTITINYNISYNAGTSPESITENAIECLAYVKHLEDSGTRVSLNVCWVTEKLKHYFAWSIPVKKTSERFSLAKVAFCLCHPSMLRRIAFGCLEREHEAGEEFVWSYGHSIREANELRKVFPETQFFGI